MDNNLFNTGSNAEGHNEDAYTVSNGTGSGVYHVDNNALGTHQDTEQQYNTQQNMIEHQWQPYNASQMNMSAVQPKQNNKKEKQQYERY